MKGEIIKEVRVSPAAYTKMMMHASKHASWAVDGLCLGRIVGDAVEVDDVFPLFHNGTLGPMLEAATSVAEKFGTVVGYYFANEHLEDAGLGRAPTVGDGLGSAVLLQISNKDLADPSHHGLDLYVKDSTWIPSRSINVPSTALNLFLSAIDDGLDVVDFDNHLNDVSKDFRNLHINSYVLQHHTS